MVIFNLSSAVTSIWGVPYISINISNNNESNIQINLQEVCTRDVFRTQSNIYNGACWKSIDKKKYHAVFQE